jgi:hypothetical protein
MRARLAPAATLTLSSAEHLVAFAKFRFGHGDLLGAEPGRMIERPDCQLVEYEHRKESGTWKEPHCEAQVMAAVGHERPSRMR